MGDRARERRLGFIAYGDAEGSFFEPGPRLGLGFTSMSPNPKLGVYPASAQGLYADTAWGGSYSLQISRRARLHLGAELGYAYGLIGLADAAEVARTSGIFVSILAGAALAP